MNRRQCRQVCAYFDKMERSSDLDIRPGIRDYQRKELVTIQMSLKTLLTQRKCKAAATLFALTALIGTVPAGMAGAVAAPAVNPSLIPLGSWPDTVAHCNIGWCKGQDFPNPTVIAAYDPVSGAFSGTDGSSFVVTGKMNGSSFTMTTVEGSYVSRSKGRISRNGRSWSGTWKDSNKVGGTITGTRTLQHSTYFDGKWVVTSKCTAGSCPKPATAKNGLEIIGVDAPTGIFTGSLGGAKVAGQVDTGGKTPIISFRVHAPRSGYAATFSAGRLTPSAMTGGTWLDSMGLSGSWTAKLEDNPEKMCGKTPTAACSGLDSFLSPGQLQTCVSYWEVCDGFGGLTPNPIQTCVANVGGACYGFGGMTPNEVQTCVALVSDCGGFAGLTPPQTQTCVSYWTSCEGFGGMTPPQIKTCVANVGGACEGFGPASESQLQACVANVGGACEGFGPPTKAKTITPSALDPWTLECGSDTYSGFLFDNIKCKDAITVTTASPSPSSSAHTRAAAPLVLSKAIAVVGAHDIVTGRLEVLDPTAKTYLAKLAKKGSELTLHITFSFQLLRKGNPVGKGPHIFQETLHTQVKSRF
jgi:hypothetical protein